eukprot:gene13689-13667_t
MPTPTLQQPAMESRIRCRSASASTEAEAEFCNSEDFGKRTKWQRNAFKVAPSDIIEQRGSRSTGASAKTAFIPGLCTVYQWQQRRARHNRPVSRAAPTEPPLGGAWASSLSAVRNILKPGSLKSPNRQKRERKVADAIAGRSTELLGTATESTFGCARFTTTTNTMLSAAKFKIIYETHPHPRGSYSGATVGGFLN